MKRQEDVAMILHLMNAQQNFMLMLLLEVLKRWVIVFVATDSQPTVSVYAGP